MVFDGFDIRIRRISEMGRFVIVPMDHGVTIGPVNGIMDPHTTIERISKGGATGIVVHKGLVNNGLEMAGKGTGTIIHLSASTSMGSDPNAKVLVCSVEEAMKLGADAVSVHVNIGSDTEREMLRDLGSVSTSCRKWRIPLLVMIYTRGRSIKDPLDPAGIAHAARAAAELGADVVKTNYTGDIDSFREVTRGCPVPVVIAGGPRMNNDREVLEMISGSLDAGGKGVSIGRNIFQHKDPELFVRSMRKIIIDDGTVEEALEVLGR